MGVNLYYDAMVKFEHEKPHGADDPTYKPPHGHDKELSESERAHTGKVGHKPRHGIDAIGRVPTKSTYDRRMNFLEGK